MMSSLQSLREFISERLAAAAEEIFRHCEGTIVQYEQELCRQRRLLDIRKPQLQLHHIVVPQHYVTEEEDLWTQQRSLRAEQEELEPPHIEKEQGEPKPPQIKEEQEELSICQDKEQLNLKQEADALMEIPTTYDENVHNVADLSSQKSFYFTDSHNEEENQHEESTSTTDEETDPQNTDQRKRRDKSSLMSESRCDSDDGNKSEKLSLVKKHKQSPKEKSLSITTSVKRTRTAPNVFFQIRTQSDKRCYVCEECSKSFGYWSQLRLHMRTHTGEKPFSCKDCDKSFSHKSNLKTHMRTHTGQRPFSCKLCGTSFSQISHLKSHMRTHTGEKPFTCKQCDTRFSHKCNLKTHMRTHSGDELFFL